jgi:hypothetical protein
MTQGDIIDGLKELGADSPENGVFPSELINFFPMMNKSSVYRCLRDCKKNRRIKAAGRKIYLS